MGSTKPRSKARRTPSTISQIFTCRRTTQPLMFQCWWRSVGHTHTAFVIETLIDELATRARMDPIAYRRKLLKPEAKKLFSTLDLLEKTIAGWRNHLPKGHALGISCHESFGTGVACAVDVSIENKRPKIHRATHAVD